MSALWVKQFHPCHSALVLIASRRVGSCVSAGRRLSAMCETAADLAEVLASRSACVLRPTGDDRFGAATLLVNRPWTFAKAGKAARMLRRRFGDRIVLATGVALFVLGLVLGRSESVRCASIWPVGHGADNSWGGDQQIATVVGTLTWSSEGRSRVHENPDGEASRGTATRGPGLGTACLLCTMVGVRRQRRAYDGRLACSARRSACVLRTTVGLRAPHDGRLACSARRSACGASRTTSGASRATYGGQEAADQEE